MQGLIDVLKKKTFWSAVALAVLVALRDYGIEVPGWIDGAVVSFLGASVAHGQIKAAQGRL